MVSFTEQSFYFDLNLSSEGSNLVLPVYVSLTFRVPIAHDLHFMNHQKPKFQAKILFNVTKEESHLA